MKHVLKCGTFLFLFRPFTIHLSSLCILSVKRQTAGRHTKESSAFSVLPRCAEAGAAAGLGGSRVTVTNCCTSTGSSADFSLGGPWDDSTTDTPKQLWVAAGVVHQSSPSAAGTALLVANIFYHTQPSLMSFHYFWIRIILVCLLERSDWLFAPISWRKPAC